MNTSPFHSVPTLDETRVRMLDRRLGGAFRQLGEDFFSQCNESLDIIQARIDRGDLSHVREKAHQMKGAAASLGMSRLSAIFAAVNETARLGQDMPKEWIAEARRALDEGQSAFRSVVGASHSL